MPVRRSVPETPPPTHVRLDWVSRTERLPIERLCVLLAIAGDESTGAAPAVAVGYLRFASGDRGCPFFVIPGFGRDFTVTHWAACFDASFWSPSWKNREMNKRAIEDEERRVRWAAERAEAEARP